MLAIIGSNVSITPHFGIFDSNCKTNVAKVTKIGFLGSMTGPQFNKWRTDHDLTLREVATDYLGGEVTHTAVSKWERSTSAIPQWAADKILGKTIIKLPIDELHQLLDAAREDNLPAQDMIAQSIREWLERRKHPEIIEREVTLAGQKLKIIQPAVLYSTEPAPALKVAEQHPAPPPQVQQILCTPASPVPPQSPAPER